MTQQRERDVTFVSIALQLNAEAFAAGRIDVSFHALTTALRAANDAADAECLDSVAKRAREQQAAIDLSYSTHWLSTYSASPKVTSALTLIARQAELQASLLRNRIDLA